MASNAPAAVSSTVNAVKRAMKPFAHRSISVSVSPVPVNFAERRSVLQVLERYGPVEFFKSVPGHYSMFISLMKEEADASKIITLSPISFNVFVPQKAPDSLLSGLNGSQSLSKSKPITAVKTADASPGDAPANSAPDVELSQKEFQLQVWPHPTFRHHDSSPTKLHLAWPDHVSTNPSFVTKMLSQSLPSTMAAKGLANWDPDFGKQQVASESVLKRQSRIQMASWIPSKLQARAAQQSQPTRATNEEATGKATDMSGFPFTSQFD